MQKKAVATDKAPKAVGPYSQAVEVGGLLFVAGQIAVDPRTGDFVKGSIDVQANRVLQNIRAIIEEAGGEMDDIFKTTIFLTDMNDYVEVNGAYAKFFKEPFPARATVGVASLPKGAKIEIEAMAYVPQNRGCGECGEGCREGCC